METENNNLKHIKGFDFDGVISLGITPGKEDVIITGRCIDEQVYVRGILQNRGINNKVYFNPLTLEERGNHTIKARLYSGRHKANTIGKLRNDGIIVTRFFEDDPIQLDCIKEEFPEVELVHIVSNLVQK